MGFAKAAGNFRCDTAYLVTQAISGAEHIARMSRLIEEERPNLVIPARN
jgi:hypothetical protein